MVLFVAYIIKTKVFLFFITSFSFLFVFALLSENQCPTLIAREFSSGSDVTSRLEFLLLLMSCSLFSSAKPEARVLTDPKNND